MQIFTLVRCLITISLAFCIDKQESTTSVDLIIRMGLGHLNIHCHLLECRANRPTQGTFLQIFLQIFETRSRLSQMRLKFFPIQSLFYKQRSLGRDRKEIFEVQTKKITKMQRKT